MRLLNRDKGNRDKGNRDKGLQPLASGNSGTKTKAQLLASKVSVNMGDITQKSGYYGMCCSYEYAFQPEYTGGFDVVIGNPPYVQSHSLDQPTKDFIYKNFETTEYQINTYGVFIDKAFDLLDKKALYGLIIPNYWLSTQYDSKLRKKVFQQNEAIEIINLFEVFAEATVDTCILIGRKDDEELFPKKTKVKSIDPSLKTINERLLSISSNEWYFVEEKVFGKNDDKVEVRFYPSLELDGKSTLKDYFNFHQGMKPYEKGKGTPEQTREMMNSKVYHSSSKVDDTYFPLLKARNVQRYFAKGTTGYIKYGKNLAAPRSKDLFIGRRILLNRILSGEKIDGIYIETEIVNNTDITNLLPKDGNNPKIYLPLILSKLCATYFKLENVNLSRAAYPKINVNTLEKFPIPELSERVSAQLISYTDEMQELHSDLYEHMIKFIELLLNKFDIDKLSRKLENWHELSFKQFLKELKKKKVQLSLSEEAEWMDYFNQQKAKADVLKSQISQTDKEIDQMVYELYGLSEEEVGVVENAGN